MEKNIYITALHMQHGGIEMAISLLSNAFAKRGYKVTILCIYNLGDVAYSLEPGVTVQYLTDVVPNRESFLNAKKERAIMKMLKEGIYSLKVLCLKYKSMRDILKEIKEGTVISTRNEHSVLLSKYGAKKVHKIAQLHHDHGFKKSFIKDFQNRYGNIDHFVLLTEELRQEVETMLSGHNCHTKCVTIPNFLDALTYEQHLDDKEKTVITVGRLHPVKGLERLIDIWNLVAIKDTEWKLKIIGGGELEKSLREKVDSLQLGDRVEITGSMAHDLVMEEMKHASIYAMTSLSEAFPFVLIEAMANALPVVAFDVRVGPRAIIEHGKDGILVKDNNLEEFSNSVIMLMEDGDRRQDMSKNAIHKAECFSESNVMERWIELLTDMNN